MIRNICLLAAAVLPAASTSAGVAGYYMFPTIHGERIVFAAEGDLWETTTAGGIATRLTSHPGSEFMPRFSPDGKWLAFSAEYQGNVDVYVMPADGGEPRRLTAHPERDEVVGWRPDSKTIVFRSQRVSANRDFNLFDISIEGGQPKVVPIGFAALASFSSDGRWVAFNRTSLEFRTWKRYRGGTADDIWVGDLSAGKFQRVTDWEGDDRFPLWSGGRVYYLSDRSERMNLYSSLPDGTDVRQHTHHDDYDVRWPDIDGDHCVYMLGGDLFLLDVASGQARRLPIELPTDRVRHRTRFENATKTLESYDLDEEGKHVAISSRGEVWLAPAKPGRIIQLTHSSGIRERAAVISPDGKQVACISDQTGEQELCLLDAAAKKPPRVLTSAKKGWIFGPQWSPDSKKLAYSDLTMTLYVVDVATGQSTRVDASTAAEITEYTFSPDSRWLAYSKAEANGNNSIYLYSVEQDRSWAATTMYTNDTSPAWDPCGRYLYFLSHRSIDPILCDFDLEFIVTQDQRPYVLILAADGKSPLLPEELLDDESCKDEDEDSDEDDDTPPPVRIDVEGLQSRVVEIPVEPDNYSSLRATADRLFYLSAETEGLMGEEALGGDDEKARFTLHAYDFEKRKDEVFIDKLRDYDVSDDGTRLAWRVTDEIQFGSTDEKPGKPAEDEDSDKPKEKVDPAKLPLEVDPAAEWTQIFTEAWRLQRDFYWAENMAGIDWNAMRAKYEPLVSRISTRSELNDLIGQLIAELGTSHTYVFGGDLEESKKIEVGLLGADIEFDDQSGHYRFQRVLKPEVWESDVVSPLAMSHARVGDGDYLFAVNGRDLGPRDSVDEQLANLAGVQVQLTVGHKPDRSDARDIQIETLKSERKLRYRDWVRRNRAYVEQKSDGKIGYLHLPDMMGPGLFEFIKAFFPQTHRPALLIDVRYNGGGFVSQMILERLGRRVTGFDRPRRGQIETYPYRAHMGPKAVLLNHWSGSDGDIFPQNFKLLGLGPIIGRRSWGGVIGIRGDKKFIDGGLSTQPEFAWFELKGGWTLENHGVDPDIDVDITPEDYVAGRDPQLDRGIAVLMQALQEHPFQEPTAPPFPNKASNKRN